MWSSRLEVVVPQVHVDEIVRRRLFAPELTRSKPYRVEMLRFFAQQVCVRVGKQKDTAIEDDDTPLCAHVTR